MESAFNHTILDLLKLRENRLDLLRCHVALVTADPTSTRDIFQTRSSETLDMTRTQCRWILRQ